MMHLMKRCHCCSVRYGYQASGNGCGNALNNDRYCPDCMKLIVEALKGVKPVVEKITLPVPENHDISIDLFEQKYKAWEEKDIIHLYPLHWSPENFKFKELRIKYRQYLLTENTDTGEKLLEVIYEKNVKTGELEDYWYEQYTDD